MTKEKKPKETDNNKILLENYKLDKVRVAGELENIKRAFTMAQGTLIFLAQKIAQLEQPVEEKPNEKEVA